MNENFMKTKLVQIGNSHIVQIPKRLLKQAGLESNVEMNVVGKTIVIRAHSKPRADWAKSLAKMVAYGDDQLMDGVAFGTLWDEAEWEW